nr:DUF3899 domain-containing protein [uncultured Acetatifactor sp.]
MKDRKIFLRYGMAMAAAAAIAILVTLMETDFYGLDKKMLFRFLSDGFFVAAVFYIGFGLLTWIADAGNFHAFGYLGYMVVRLFSPMKHRFEERKDFFTYYTEKKTQRREGKTSPKRILLTVGAVCAVLAIVFAGIFYRI